MKKRFVVYILIFVTFLMYQYGRSIWYPTLVKFMGKKTVAEVIKALDKKTEENLSPLFIKNGISYPPKKLALIAFKDTDILEVWASNGDTKFRKIKEYPVLAASGNLGPKLIEGDRQVPEGLYKVIGFNPNSSYHLSMKINYPNSFDLKHAKAEGRNSPGTNIFIHGKSASIGCLAMGDSAIEQLFTLVFKTGINNTQILISPSNPSRVKLIAPSDSPSWVTDLYNKINLTHELITGTHNKPFKQVK
jgi:murein L,D-transpeptidase YafK